MLRQFLVCFWRGGGATWTAVGETLGRSADAARARYGHVRLL
ncbi:hypothetical protein ACIQI7_21630 [Kitasatospora sp. NPDC092039]